MKRVEELLDRLSRVEGVVEADFDYVTRKLRVSHEGGDETVRRIDELVRPFRVRSRQASRIADGLNP